MRLPLLNEYLSHVARYKDGTTNVMVACPFCGDSANHDKPGNLSIKIEINPGDPILFNCFRANCGRSGRLTVKILQEDFGCDDHDTLKELAEYNKSVDGQSTFKPFIQKKSRGFEVVNLRSINNAAKLQYLNNRLGTTLEEPDLRKYKIQLSLYDFIEVNGIKRLAFKKEKCDQLDEYTICFMSMYGDYLICRDITATKSTGMRYHNYRIAGKPDPNDRKFYSIPAEIDLLNPEPAVLHCAEGIFSLLGAYFFTSEKSTRKNEIWLAMCGSGYKNPILHMIRQYGLLSIELHIWSDTEVSMKLYEDLYKQLKKHTNIESMVVHYNTRKEDFGYPAKDIAVSTITIR